jgi:hypothetical protein
VAPGRNSGTGAVTVITLWESGDQCWSAKHRRRRCGCAGLHSVRWLAPSRTGQWYPLAENRGEWGSLAPIVLATPARSRAWATRPQKPRVHLS